MSSADKAARSTETDLRTELASQMRPIFDEACVRALDLAPCGDA
jgi:hypothetical protein